MKTIQIQGQTIELPFTEEEYQEMCEECTSQFASGIFPFSSLRANIDTGAISIETAMDTALVIGLHLAEKAREDEILALKHEIMGWEAEVESLEKKLENSIVAFEILPKTINTMEITNEAAKLLKCQAEEVATNYIWINEGDSSDETYIFRKGLVKGFELGVAKGDLIKQLEIDLLRERVKELEANNGILLDAVTTVFEGYEMDGMENMHTRDEVFYEQCSNALRGINRFQLPDVFCVKNDGSMDFISFVVGWMNKVSNGAEWSGDNEGEYFGRDLQGNCRCDTEPFGTILSLYQFMKLSRRE